MNIALPLTADHEFSTHYGAAAKFAVFELDPDKRTVLHHKVVDPQAAEPCSWAPLLQAAGVDLVLAGGMGRGAQLRLAECGVKVVVGLPAAAPAELVAAWLAGRLHGGDNACDGGHDSGDCHGHVHSHHGDHEHGCPHTH